MWPQLYDQKLAFSGDKGCPVLLQAMRSKHAFPLKKDKAAPTTLYAFGLRPLLRITPFIPFLFQKVSRSTGLFVPDRGCLRLTIAFVLAGFVSLLSTVLLISFVSGILHSTEGEPANSRVTVAAFLAFGIFNSFEALISLVVSFQKAPQICAWANMIGEVEGRLHLYNEKEFKKVARTAGLLTFVYMGFVSFLYLLLTLLIGFGVAICDDITEVPESIRLMLYAIGTTAFFNPTAIQPVGLITYSAFLFKNYVRWTSLRVASTLTTAGVHYDVASQRLDSYRLAYTKLKAIAKCISNTWAICFVVTFGGSIPMLCLIIYHSTVNEGSLKFKAYFICQGVIILFKILVPMYIASDVEPAIKKLQRTLLEAHMDRAPNTFLSQVAQFERGLNPELDLKCSGCGLFLVDLRSFTAIIGLVITYSLVIIQGTTGA